MGVLRDAAGDLVGRLAERAGAGPGPSGDAEPLTVPRLRGRHVVLVGVLLLVAVLGAVVLFVRGKPVSELAPTPMSHATVVAGGTSPPAATPTVTASLLVHVAGKVRRPGVVRLAAGSRVIDAVNASGGALPGADLAGLNLARPLADGEQILVGIPPPPGGPVVAAPGPSAPSAPEVLDLNAATTEQLDGLPGVGPVLAQRIVDFRTEHGRFTSVDELQQVTGIGSRKFAELRDKVRV